MATQNTRIRGRSLPSKVSKKNARCFFWFLTGKCRNGSFCKFSHEEKKKRIYVAKPQHSSAPLHPPTNIMEMEAKEP